MPKVKPEKEIIADVEFKGLDHFISKHTTPYDWRKVWELKDVSHDAEKLPTISNGKQKFSGAALVIFKDRVTEKLAVGSTKNIANYLINFDYDAIDSGKYGVGPSKTLFPDIYIKPCSSVDVAKTASLKLRSKIKQAKLVP